MFRSFDIRKPAQLYLAGLKPAMAYGEVVADGNGASRYVVRIRQLDGVKEREVGSVVNNQLVRLGNAGKGRRTTRHHDVVRFFTNCDAKWLNVQLSAVRLTANNNRAVLVKGQSFIYSCTIGDKKVLPRC